MKEGCIYLAGGCFWCTEAVFARVRGVSSVQSGYANGHLENPRYEDVCRGDSGHAEAVRVCFDAQVIGLADLLAIFFATHDPTTPNRQGQDVGPQYRSGIYTVHESQAQVARAVMAGLAGAWPQPLVTEVLPLSAWWPAEEWHQQYFAKNPGQGFCQMVVVPKVDKLRRAFANFTKDVS